MLLKGGHTIRACSRHSKKALRLIAFSALEGSFSCVIDFKDFCLRSLSRLLLGRGERLVESCGLSPGAAAHSEELKYEFRFRALAPLRSLVS